MWVFWVAWLLVGLGVELWAANKRPNEGATLSENWWALDRWLARWPWLRVPVHFLLAGFLIVLVPHLLWGKGL